MKHVIKEVNTPREAEIFENGASRQQTAAYWGVSTRTVDRLIAKGEVPALRRHHLVRIPVEALDRLKWKYQNPMGLTPLARLEKEL